ncbi:MAG: PHP domain-containing protein [Chthoniobacterales bacterium]
MRARAISRSRGGLSNGEIAELLARQAEKSSGILVRAFRRAARSAFLWPENVVDLIAHNRPLSELRAVGPYMTKQIQDWIRRPPPPTRVPPLRRDFFTLADARALLKTNPAWAESLRGDLQMHTRWSDGSGTIADMAEAARQRGYEYIAITDHSKTLKIAGGIDETQLKKQIAEIAKTNRSIRRDGGELIVVSSIELNLDPRGNGDMDARVLAMLDLVLGSFHSALRKKEDQTERYLAALRNPHIQILGHPRGRIYNYRIGLKADWQRVFGEAARLNKALEIDSYPDRQDLNLSLLKLARREGCRISLGTDAHHPWQLEFIDLGLAAALKAKIPAERIINFMSIQQLKQWVANVRVKKTRRKLKPSKCFPPQSSPSRRGGRVSAG